MVKNMQMIGKHCLIGSSGNEYADDWRTVFGSNGKEYADDWGALFDSNGDEYANDWRRFLS